MSSLDFDIDSRVNFLEQEWREAFEAGIEASAQYKSLMRERSAQPASIARAREQIERVELAKSRIMAKIERLEESLNQ